MSAINNSINLTDRMSPVLKTVMKALDSTLKALDRVDRASNHGLNSAAFRQAARDVNVASAEIESLIGKLHKTPPILGKIQSGFDKIAKSSSGVKNNWASVTTGVNSVLSIFDRLGAKISSVMDSVDKSRAAIARLNLYNTSDISGEQYYDEIYRTALATRTSLEDTADMVNKILISGVYQGEGNVMSSIKTAGLINKALIAGGGTAEQNSRAIVQLMQGLSSGVLQGDELRSIREQAPYLADLLAQGLARIDNKFEGISIGDLKELGAQGELTSNTVIRALMAIEDTIDDAFESMPKTFRQGITSLKTIWMRFLWQLSLVDGPLAKINDLVWELVDFLNSEDGDKFFEGLAKAIRIVVDVLIWLIDVGKSVVSFFQNNTPILEALFISVGVAAVSAGIAAFIAWIGVAWPILLIIALVGLVSYVFMYFGATVGEVVGGIIGIVLFLGYLLYDVILVVISAIGIAVVGIGMIVVLVLQGIVQAILWLITTIWAILVTIGNVIYTVIVGAWGVVKGVIVGLYGLFVGLGEAVLGILYAIASAIDFVFGSNLADTVGGWADGLNQSVEDLNNALDPLGEFEKIGDQWKTSFGALGDMYAGNGKYDDWNITDNMEDIWNGGTGIIDGIWNWAGDNMANPMDGWNSGMDIGVGLVDKLGNYKGMGIPNEAELQALLNGGMPINGGDLDSVGSIKNDVNINDEDIQLLRDMAARDYLLNLQQITPVAHISFGDVRETADVNKIMDVIEDMVEEQMATSLVSN